MTGNADPWEAPGRRRPGYSRAVGIGLALAAATLVVYARVAGHGFVIEAREYIAGNPWVAEGLTWDGIVRSFMEFHAHNWHPLTWLSHMVDVELYGVEPAGHHLTNAVLHAMNAVLLFGVLLSMTGREWRAGFVAGLFALHPLHVESVAWALERKDVLSTLFWLLTLWSWTWFSRRPGWRRYAVVIVPFSLALLAKPMAVTLPFVLLLLDYWPLERFARGDGASRAARLALEKAPLVALSGAVSAITFAAQQGAVASLDRFPLSLRIGNALVSYFTYVGKAIWPVGLSFFYPYPDAISGWKVFGAGLALAVATAAALLARRRVPYLPVGWFWYLGTLVPVIGLVQVGAQARADRYTYVPLVGLFLVAVWGAADLLEARRRGKTLLAAAGVIVLAVCAVLSWRQVGYWKDDLSILECSARTTPDNYFAHYNLANHLKRAGRVDEAVAHYREALRIRPGWGAAHLNLGNTLRGEGRVEEAIAHYTEAVRLDPGDWMALYALGDVELDRGNVSSALGHLREARRLRPDDPEVLNDLGIALLVQGNLPEALKTLAEAVRLRPDAVRHNTFGVALLQQGRLDEAIVHFEEALRLQPDYEKASRNLEAARVRMTQEPAGAK